MADDTGKFIIDKEELKPGLIIYRRSDVQHRRWYCRVKIFQSDGFDDGEARPDRADIRARYKNRYKTVSLKTDDINTARQRAWKQDSKVHHAIMFDAALFNRAFSQVAKEWLTKQKARAKRGEITAKRIETLTNIIEGPLNEYVGSVQVHLIGDERWGSYPMWRRENGEGRMERNGSRMVTPEIAEKLVAAEFERRQKASTARGIRPKKPAPERIAEAIKEKLAKPVPYVSDDTIRGEMKVFGAIMNFAIKQRYVPASLRFEAFPALKVNRREEFTPEEYRKLYSAGRAWVKAKTTKDENGKVVKTPNRTNAVWYRTIVYNLILIACNTGMRPPELRNLRWRDITPAKDREGRDIFVLFVQGKGKTRKLVAPASVGTYLDRIRKISKATQPDDLVFTTITGKPAKTLYQSLIEDLLTETGLRKGADGTMRTTYCFRHTYATFRLQMGVDVYFLAQQMGTSVQMIEKHYGHVNTIRHADRVLMGMEGWDPVMTADDGEAGEGSARERQAVKAKQPAKAKAPASRSRPKR